jgi:hypothetical protein
VKPARRDKTLCARLDGFAPEASTRRHGKFSAVKKGLGSTALIASATAASASPAAISTTATTVPVTSAASAMFRLRTSFVYVKRTTANF